MKMLQSIMEAKTSSYLLYKFFSQTVMFVSLHKIHFRILHNKLTMITKSVSYISEAKAIILKNSSCVIRYKSL